MRFVRPGRIEFAQPPLVVFGPVIEIALRGSGKGFSAQLLTQREQLIHQGLDQVCLRHIADIGHDEHPMEKSGHQRRVMCAQQTPRGVVLAELL